MGLSSFTKSGYFMHDYVHLFTPFTFENKSASCTKENIHDLANICLVTKTGTDKLSFHHHHCQIMLFPHTNMHSQRQDHPSNLHCVIHATKAGRNSQRSWEASCVVLNGGNSILWKGFTKDCASLRTAAP